MAAPGDLLTELGIQVAICKVWDPILLAFVSPYYTKRDKLSAADLALNIWAPPPASWPHVEPPLEGCEQDAERVIIERATITRDWRCAW